MDILVVCESRLDSSVLDASIAIDGYVHFRCDRPTNGGGVIVYAKETIACNRISTHTNIELIIIALHGTRGGRTLVFATYNPNYAHAAVFCDAIEDAVLSHARPRDTIIVLGDTNIDALDKHRRPHLDRLCAACALTLHVERATHERACIDHILTNATATDVCHYAPIERAHEPISCLVHLHAPVERQRERPTPRPSWRKCDWEKMATWLALMRLEDMVTSASSIDDAYDLLVHAFHTSIVLHVPFESARRRTRPMWMTENVQYAMCARDRAYKRWKNNPTKERLQIRLQAKKIARKIMAQAQSKVVNTILARDATIKGAFRSLKSIAKVEQQKMPSIVDGARVITKSEEKANVLATAFARVWTAPGRSPKMQPVPHETIKSVRRPGWHMHSRPSRRTRLPVATALRPSSSNACATSSLYHSPKSSIAP